MKLTKEMLLQIINDAQKIVDDKNYPIDVRIRSKITVNDCVIRADTEGWDLKYLGGGKWGLDA